MGMLAKPRVNCQSDGYKHFDKPDLPESSTEVRRSAATTRLKGHKPQNQTPQNLIEALPFVIQLWQPSFQDQQADRVEDTPQANCQLTERLPVRPLQKAILNISAMQLFQKLSDRQAQDQEVIEASSS